ncbi:hypothetical protein BV25DRAFT_1821919 [Artomyces pyxidatus]|uniref:Uncharacterized protein n=1 Tax=Artomyces pyxidatus TaxID=48021 RepID=A0ACB8TBG9_9AGAM|nr:hypothetical protein BV25DRAFT_1821919 [Artomyces pyxidatus]
MIKFSAPVSTSSRSADKSAVRRRKRPHPRHQVKKLDKQQLSPDATEYVNLPAFPVDVFLEIFVYLTPEELLNLSRSNKWLRDILTKRVLEPAWRNARDNVPDLPPCPTDMNELRYASLMFDKFCQSCLAEEVCVPIWSTRSRLCDSCLEAEFTAVSKRPRGKNSVGVWLSALKTVSISVPKKDPTGTIPWADMGTIYKKSDLDCLTEHFSSLSLGNDDKPLSERVKELQHLRAVSSDDRKYQEWLSSRLRDVEKAQRQSEADKAKEREQLLQVRFKEISNRLQKMGYTQELLITKLRHPLEKHPVVNVPQELSEEEWEKIRPQLETHMNSLRNTRRRFNRKEVLIARCSSFVRTLNKWALKVPGMADHHFIDLLHLPDVRRIIDAPGDATSISDEDMNTIQARLPEWWAAWLKTLDGRLVQLSPALQVTYDAQQTINHPEAIFVCRKCKTYLSHPSVLFHSHNNGPYKAMYTGPTTEICGDVYEHATRETCLHLPWSHEALQAADRVDRIMNIMSVCGVDPNTQSLEDMPSLDSVRLECVSCAGTVRGAVMNWQSAIRHASSSHLHGEMKWVLTSDAVTARALELEADLRKKSAQTHKGLPFTDCPCTACNQWLDLNNRLEDKDCIPQQGGNTEEFENYRPRDIVVAVFPSGTVDLNQTERFWRICGGAAVLVI